MAITASCGSEFHKFNSAWTKEFLAFVCPQSATEQCNEVTPEGFWCSGWGRKVLPLQFLPIWLILFCLLLTLRFFPPSEPKSPKHFILALGAGVLALCDHLGCLLFLFISLPLLSIYYYECVCLFKLRQGNKNHSQNSQGWPQHRLK